MWISQKWNGFDPKSYRLFKSCLVSDYDKYTVVVKLLFTQKISHPIEPKILKGFSLFSLKYKQNIDILKNLNDKIKNILYLKKTILQGMKLK